MITMSWLTFHHSMKWPNKWNCYDLLLGGGIWWGIRTFRRSCRVFSRIWRGFFPTVGVWGGRGFWDFGTWGRTKIPLAFTHQRWFPFCQICDSHFAKSAIPFCQIGDSHFVKSVIQILLNQLFTFCQIIDSHFDKSVIHMC